MIRTGAPLAAAVAMAWLPGPLAAQTTPHAPPAHETLECGEATGILLAQPPGAMRDLMERLYRADGCAGLLAGEQGITPVEVGAPGAGCRAAAEALGSVRAYERRRVAYLYRRMCAEGATGITWDAGTRTPAAPR